MKSMGFVSRFMAVGGTWATPGLRRAIIIRTVSPILLNAGHAVTPDFIESLMVGSDGLSPVETGKKVNLLLCAEMDRLSPASKLASA